MNTGKALRIRSFVETTPTGTGLFGRQGRKKAATLQPSKSYHPFYKPSETAGN